MEDLWVVKSWPSWDREAPQIVEGVFSSLEKARIAVSKVELVNPDHCAVVDGPLKLDSLRYGGI
jgi:hypothetical protein